VTQRYRLNVKLDDVKGIATGMEGLLLSTVEIEGEAKPACVAEVVFRFYAAK